MVKFSDLVGKRVHLYDDNANVTYENCLLDGLDGDVMTLITEDDDKIYVSVNSGLAASIEEAKVKDEEDDESAKDEDYDGGNDESIPDEDEVEQVELLSLEEREKLEKKKKFQRFINVVIIGLAVVVLLTLMF